jgi:GNAT superfamily N-acetyltransferase
MERRVAKGAGARDYTAHVPYDAGAMQIRTLERREIELVWTIDRRERIERIYRLEAGELRLEPHAVDVPGWHPETRRTMTPWLYENFDRGGLLYGAFEDEQHVGVAPLDTIWRGRRGDLLQLEFFHVSRDYRGRGIGVALFDHARAAARARGARGLYISATESENTVHFYQRRGAVLLDTPDPELYAREPEDIHLECAV